MQQAYRPATPRTAEQNLLFEPGHTVVLWTPEKLNLADRKVGIHTAEARHFIVLTDQTYRVRDETERMFMADAGEERGIISETRMAHNCAFEILLRHGARGAVVIDSLCDTSVAKIKQLEDKLAAKGWFEVPQLQGLLAILDQIAPSDQIEQEAIDQLRIAINTGINFRMAKLDDSVQEAEQAKKDGGFGRSNLTRTERDYYGEIGFDLPEMLSQPERNRGGDVQAQPDQTSQIRETAAAIAGPFAEAMNAAFASFTDQMMQKVDAKLAASQKGDLTNGSEETAEVKRGPGRPKKAEETVAA